MFKWVKMKLGCSEEMTRLQLPTFHPCHSAPRLLQGGGRDSWLNTPKNGRRAFMSDFPSRCTTCTHTMSPKPCITRIPLKLKCHHGFWIKGLVGVLFKVSEDSHFFPIVNTSFHLLAPSFCGLSKQLNRKQFEMCFVNHWLNLTYLTYSFLHQ